MGRYPHRLERTLACLREKADHEGFVREPHDFLREISVQNISQALAKLEEGKEIKIYERTEGRRTRVTLLKVLGKVPSPTEQNKVSEVAPAEPKLPAAGSGRHHSLAVSDRSWKAKPTGVLQMLELLNIRAREEGTYPLVHDPLYVFQMNGIQHHALYLGALERQKRVEVTRGEGRNGKAPYEIKILEPGEEPSQRKKSTLIKRDHGGVSGTARPEADSGSGVQRVQSGSRTLALIDLENALLGMDTEDQCLNAQRFKNICLNYGSNVGIRCFVSEDTYHALENKISAILPSFPIILTANGKNMVDTIILEEFRTAIRHNLADTFLLATCDGGEAYKDLVKEAQAHGKNVELLVITKGVSHALANHVGQKHIIDGAQHDPKERHFKQLIRSLVRTQTLDLKVQDIVFIRTIVCVLMSSMNPDQPPLFTDMYKRLWNMLDGRTKAAYRMIDCKYVLQSLVAISQTLFYRSESFIYEGKNKMRKRYYVDRHNPLVRLCIS